MFLCFFLTILVFRRCAQQHGAAGGHDEAGDPPGDDGEEPNKGDQAQGDATSLLKNMNFYRCQSLTCSVWRIKRFHPWRRNCSLYVNQVNFHRLRLILVLFWDLILIWAVNTLCVPRQHRWSERQKLSGKEMWTTAEPSVGDGGQIW